MTRMFKLAATAALLANAVLAQAGTVTFSGGQDFKYLWGSRPLGLDGTFYSESGLLFTSSLRGGLISWAMTSPNNADFFGSTLLENWTGATVTATGWYGASFTLNSFEMADANNVGAVGNIAFSYTDASGSHAEQLALPGAPGLKTYDFNLVGLTSFTLTQAHPGFQIDNVVIDEPIPAPVPVPAPVPEPAAAALMLAGLAAGVIARRRKA
ncbi:MAG: PEP-CTERM sorting domain-containing protein [Burkholderiales bacterium]|nr:PEP-CTERM sorting domain-containing protein [Burkholderiales bacterium]